MRKILAFLIVIAFLATPAMADWVPDDGHKMHEPQLPDPNGWDVMATGNVSLPNALTLADDWMCSSSGYVEDIHFWGSWRQDIEGEIIMFHIAIHEDIEVGPHGFSIPGEELWFREVYAPEVIISPPIPGDQGWYDPASGIVEPNDHQWFYQYNIFLDYLPPEELFYQEAGNVYWLRITAFVDDPVSTLWGWKSSYIHYRDDAVWSYYEMYPFEWWEMYEPNGGGGEPVVNPFWVAFDPAGMIIPPLSGGIDYYDDPSGINGWFYYPMEEWWNIWFYNDPFDPERYKEISIMGWVQKLEPGMPAWVEIAINWSGPDWPPGGPPPIGPGDDPFIERFPFFASDLEQGGDVFEFWEFFIEEYNPEWVSVDVRGYNFIILETEPGIIEHQCLPEGQEQSLDLAFVITGEAPVYDLWETPEGHNTHVNFGCPTIPAIPAGFFGPGSDPFDGVIALQGEPLPTTGDLGPTDTIIKRFRPADLPECPDQDEIELEIVALNLVSTAPITVTYGGMDPEEWDVRVCLSEYPQSTGSINLVRDCQEGGRFTAFIPIGPKVIFTRISDDLEVYIDFIEAGYSDIEYGIGEGYWMFSDPGFDIYTSEDGDLVSNCDDEPDIEIGQSAVDLIPGLEAIPCDNCEEPALDYNIPITSMYEGFECAQQDIWPPHDVDEDIPTLTEWGMIILGLLLLTAGTIAVVRKRKAAMARTN